MAPGYCTVTMSQVRAECVTRRRPDVKLHGGLWGLRHGSFLTLLTETRAGDSSPTVREPGGRARIEP